MIGLLLVGSIVDKEFLTNTYTKKKHPRDEIRIAWPLEKAKRIC